jgi:hypothetical protein
MRIVLAKEGESVAVSLFKIVAAVIGVSLMATLVLIGGSNAHTAACAVSEPVFSSHEGFELFPGFFDFIGDIWYGLKVFFWCVVAVGGAAICLTLMISLGIAGWLFQLVVTGIYRAGEIISGRVRRKRGIYKDGKRVETDDVLMDLLVRMDRVEGLLK